jgi:hypothetical protein
MGHGSWAIGHGPWVMGHVPWAMGHGPALPDQRSVKQAKIRRRGGKASCSLPSPLLAIGVPDRWIGSAGSQRFPLSLASLLIPSDSQSFAYRFAPDLAALRPSRASPPRRLWHRALHRAQSSNSRNTALAARRPPALERPGGGRDSPCHGFDLSHWTLTRPSPVGSGWLGKWARFARGAAGSAGVIAGDHQCWLRVAAITVIASPPIMP